jgi:hypothetical protein
MCGHGLDMNKRKGDMEIGGDIGNRNLRINLSPYLFHLLISFFTLIFAFLLK